MSFRLSCVLSCVVLVGAAVLADNTNRWEFDDALDYEVSDRELIEVDTTGGGSASLILQEDLVDRSTLTQYTNVAELIDVRLGAERVLELQRASGGEYLVPGIYRSRVFDKGIGGGRWKTLAARVSNGFLENSTGQIATNSQDLAALFHFDGDFVDQVSGLPASANSVSFNSRAMVGDESAEFTYSKAHRVVFDNKPALLNGALGVTLMGWVYPLSYQVVNEPGIFSTRSTKNGTIWIIMLPDRRVSVTMAISLTEIASFTSTETLPVEQWTALSVVWDSVSGTTKLYFGKKLVGQVTQGPSGPFSQVDPLGIGNNIHYGTYGFWGYIDEVAVWRRAISEDEIGSIVDSFQSVQFRLRSSTTPALTGPFVGPDGDGASFYVGSLDALAAAGSFNPIHQYLQYEVKLFSNGSRSQTPQVQYVKLLTTDGAFHVDSTLGDFFRGTPVQNTTNAPYTPHTPYMGLRRKPNGGYESSGVYRSAPLDGGSGAVWERMSWRLPEPIPSTDAGLIGLYHLDGNWVDVAPALGANTPGHQANAGFSSAARLGFSAATFSENSGGTVISNFFSAGQAVRALSMWMKSSSPSDGVLQVGAGELVIRDNQLVTSDFGANSPTVYLNANPQTSQLLPGWNHVALVWPGEVDGSAIAIGLAGTERYDGLIDELAFYDESLTMGQIQVQYYRAHPISSGTPVFRVRAADSLVALDGEAWSIPYSDPDNTIFSANGRYFEYEVAFNGDGVGTPVAGKIVVEGNDGIASFEFETSRFEDAALGDFGSSVAWYGDEIYIHDFAATDPENLQAADFVPADGLAGLWHFDELEWTISTVLVDSSGRGRSGNPINGAASSPNARVGLRAGSFDGVDDYAELSQITELAGSAFSVCFWFNSRQTERASLMSTYDASGGYFDVELNSDGSSQSTGQVAFVISDGASGPRSVASPSTSLNNGNWHHVVGVRDTSFIHLYIDGVRVASTSVAAAYGPVPAAVPRVGRNGTGSRYFSGLIDEVVAFGSALSPRQVGTVFASGYSTKGTSELVFSPIDAGGATIWKTLNWATDGAYGRPLAGATGVQGLWHLDAASGTTLADTSGAGNDADVIGATLGVEGVFSNGVSLNGAGNYLSIPDASALESALFSAELWIKPEAVNSRTLIDKRSGGSGYAVYTDPQGRPAFWLGGNSVSGNLPLLPNVWSHVAAVYDGTEMKLYVNGELRAKAIPVGVSVNTSVPFSIGRANAGGQFFRGIIDEVAYHIRPLTDIEILDHFRAVAGTLRFQVRAGDSLPLAGQFYGPDGTANTFFTLAQEDNLVGVVPLVRYLQVKTLIGTDDHKFSPTFYGLNVSAARYPESAPWVAVADVAAYPFLGNLIGFNHDRTYNTNTTVRYQVTGDTGTETKWYYWDTSSSKWSVQDTTNGIDVFTFQTSSRDDINDNIDRFYTEVYDKTGGDFRFKAFLKSAGDQQVSVDWTEVEASEGRITVGFPNGAERGDDALIAAVDYDITWSWTGTVSSTLAVEYSHTGPNGPWIPITGTAPRGAGGNGSWTWTTPDTLGVNLVTTETNMFIRVRDPNDNTIIDLSDDAFTLTRRFKMIQPNGGEVWYIGQTNDIIWESSYNMGGLVQLHYAPDGVNFDIGAGGYEIEFATGNNDASINTYTWGIPTGIASLLSTNGRIRVQKTTAEYTDVSDGVFTIGGAVITKPEAAKKVKRGEPYSVQWRSIAGGPSVSIDFSPDSGTTFSNLVAGVANQDGTNSWTWNVDQDGTDFAVLRIRSDSNTNVVSESKVFTVADIDVLAPDGLEVWLMETTNTIKWLAGGAGNKVNIYFRTRPDGEWQPIVMGTDNDLEYDWTVSDQVTTRARIKVESSVDTNLFAISDGNFNIAGVRVTFPNGQSDSVEKGVPFFIEHDAAPESWSGAKLEISYDEGSNYTHIADWALGGPYQYTPLIPSRKSKIRVSVNNSPGYTDIVDESDDFFTVAGILMERPLLNEVYTIGTANPIQWVSAGADGSVDVYYAPNGDTNDVVQLPSQINNQIYPGRNLVSWTVPRTINPSENARIVVRSGGYADVTEEFTVRGVRFTEPLEGDIWNIGSSQRPAWSFAAIDATALATIELSLDGGSTFAQTLTNDYPMIGLPFLPWDIPADQTPTTNAVLRLTITSSSEPNDVGVVATSDRFSLRGLRVHAPAAGSSWQLGSTNAITFTSAEMGGTFAIEYSADGGTTYDPEPIAQNLILGDGTHTVPWGIELDREPTATGVIRVSASGGAGLSGLFSIGGIRVDRPFSLDIWAAGEANTIRWVGEGTSGAFDILLLYPDATPPFSINNNVPGPSVIWNVPIGAIPNGNEATNVIVRVRDRLDPTLYGDSEPFVLVSQPRVEIEQPKAGAFWKVGEIRDVEWIRGGQLDEDDFRVFYEYGSSFEFRDELDGTVAYDPDRNLFTIPFQVGATPGIPNTLGQARVIVSNEVNANVFDISATFTIAPNFTVVYPNGDVGEDDIYANQRVNVSWTTWGDVDRVNVFYNIDDGPWVLIEGDVENNFSEPPSSPAFKTYEWHVPSFKADQVKFRVQDASYGLTSTYDGITPGPYDDSDDHFEFKFFQVLWAVGYDSEETGGRVWLDNLSVSDSSGWSESGLTSVDDDGNVVYIEHEYPYGYFDTAWYRQFFNDTVDFQWLSNSNQTRTVIMSQSQTEPDAHVLADFTYAPVADVLTALVWIERGGRILLNPDRTRVYLYNSGGTTVDTKSDDTALGDGGNGAFFQLTWPGISTNYAGISRGETYFARVEVDYNGVTYSAAVTYRLSLSADASLVEEVEAIVREVGGGLSNQVSSVQTGVDTAVNMLGTVTGATARIEAGVANIATQVTDLATTVIPAIERLTNDVSIIGSDLTALTNVVDLIADNTSADQARILSRPTTVEFGSTNSILYKTTPSLDFGTVQLEVDEANQTVIMEEITTGLGIYQADIIADWGFGSYTIVCTDPNAEDRMVLEVVTSSIAEFSQVLGVLDDLSTQVSNVTEVISGTSGDGGIQGLLSQIDSQLNAVSASLADGSSGADAVSEAISQVESLLLGGGGVGGDLVSAINAMEGDLASIDSKAGNAQSEASQARTAAQEAVSSLQQLREDLMGGFVHEASARLNEIRDNLSVANERIDNIPGTLGIDALRSQLSGVAKQVTELAAKEGFVMDSGFDEAGAGGGDGAEEDTIDTLNQQIVEMKSSMEFLRKLIEEESSEPVIQEDWLGVE